MEWPVVSAGWDAKDAWVQSVADALGWGILVWAAVATTLLLLTQLVVTRVLRHRRFWCDPVGREVEVEFEEHGLPGLRRAVAVRSCSLFDPASDVRCHRSCLNRDVRVRLPMSSPIQWRKP
jgi:heme exporter protein D